MQNSKSPYPTPTVQRRLISMVYESLLFVAVEALAMFIYLMATRNQHTPFIDHGRNALFFLVGAAYFIYCWTDSGHTLAMKTWRIKLVKVGYAKLPLRAAVLRYLLAWGWFLPAIVVCYAFGIKDKGAVGIALAVGVVVWALTAFLDKDRQFLHDKVAGTRLITLPKAGKKS
ncbi:MAG: RDD family protein [Massilia sp.]